MESAQFILFHGGKPLLGAEKFRKLPTLTGFGEAAQVSILRLAISARVIRWYIFKPKIPIWVNFGGP
jgi:hypothetical protein